MLVVLEVLLERTEMLSIYYIQYVRSGKYPDCNGEECQTSIRNWDKKN